MDDTKTRHRDNKNIGTGNFHFIGSAYHLHSFLNEEKQPYVSEEYFFIEKAMQDILLPEMEVSRPDFLVVSDVT